MPGRISIPIRSAPPGLIEECFAEQARRWKPILDVYDENGVDLCFEIHPSEDVFDGDTFDMFLDAVGGHKRCNINYDASHFIKQCMDYLGFIDVYHDRIKMFHVKDAEFNPTAKQGVYGGYKGWLERAGRDRSLGDGQVNFKAIFSKLAGYDFAGWAVYEWECCLQHPEVAARNGAQVHRRPYHRSDRPRVRRFRRHRRRSRDQSEATRHQGLMRWFTRQRRFKPRRRRLRVGMVGGGRDAFIGAVHRMAMRLDDLDRADGRRALLRSRQRARSPAPISASRPTASTPTIARWRRARRRAPDGIEAVVIVTPNHLHYPVAKAFLEAGIDVICDKPLSTTLAEAKELVALTRAKRPGVRRDAQQHRLSDGAAGARDDRRRANSARSASFMRPISRTG